MKTRPSFKTFAALALAATAVSYAANNDDAETAPEAAAWLGVATAPIDEVAAAQLDLPEGVGVAVKIVVPDSPAAAAGLKRNDILFDVGGAEVKSPEHLSELIREHDSGDAINLGVLQRGKRSEVSVTLGSRPDDLPATARQRKGAAGLQIDLGDLGNFDMKGFPFAGDANDLEAHMDKMRAQMEMHFEGMLDIEGLDDLEGALNIIDSNSKSVSMRNADGSSIEVQTKDGDTKVLAKDADGTVLFDGPANTDEQRAKMPESVRELYETTQESGASLKFRGFRFSRPKLGVPELKPGKKVDPETEEVPIPPAEKEGKKVEL